MSTLVTTFLVPALISLLPGFITSWIMTALKTVSSWVGNLPTFVKPIVVIGIAFGVAEVKRLLGLALPTTFTGILVDTLVIAMVAFGAYEIQKLFTPAPAPAPVPTPAAATAKK